MFFLVVLVPLLLAASSAFRPHVGSGPVLFPLEAVGAVKGVAGPPLTGETRGPSGIEAPSGVEAPSGIVAPSGVGAPSGVAAPSGGVEAPSGVEGPPGVKGPSLDLGGLKPTGRVAPDGSEIWGYPPGSELGEAIEVHVKDGQIVRQVLRPGSNSSQMVLSPASSQRPISAESHSELSTALEESALQGKR